MSVSAMIIAETGLDMTAFPTAGHETAIHRRLMGSRETLSPPRLKGNCVA